MFIENQNDAGSRVLETVQRDAGTYYVIGYTSRPTDTFDGKYRTIRSR